jgi:hypothetical protein
MARKRKRIVIELGLRHLEVEGDKVHYRPRRNRLIVSSGWAGSVVTLDISTAPIGSQHWPNGVTLTSEDWERTVRAVAKIVRHCKRKIVRQQPKRERSK